MVLMVLASCCWCYSCGEMIGRAARGVTNNSRQDEIDGGFGRVPAFAGRKRLLISDGHHHRRLHRPY